MATFLRPLSYRYQILYDTISAVASLTVGGERRFRHLALAGLTIQPETTILDLCCGSGQTTQYLVNHSQHVTGLDASPRSLERARHNVPQAEYVQAWAEDMPFAENSFDLVHTSAAMHEMTAQQLQEIFQEVYRVLKPGGLLTLVDFHRPTNPMMWPGLAMFLWLFETETAWNLLRTDMPKLLTEIGFQVAPIQLHGGGSLQVIHAAKVGGE